ncbi:sodium transporter [Halioglobus maricola]|uniref:Sodium transporter n=1 Tax=Halioglobus maricola TaxID=2601894 RepID=A0A5P9NLZ8_9GAMM|nr:sodium:solute symporter family protein [Halioglobus maricola]QFU76807.1 sodium transporter [Halioglobus maricola]
MPETVLAPIDWLIIAAMLSFSLLVGFMVRDSASEGGVEGFFTAGRRMKWWLLGTSIVATTFASDTPLAITGWIAQYGIAGNWFWWGGVLGSVAMTVFFARTWRNSGVVTDVELIELRYGGKPAATLRSVKAFINATLVNCIILGWVFAGMSKISESFMDWRWLLGPGFYDSLAGAYPEVLLFGSFDNTLTIAVLVAVTLAYSALGGMRAVIITDLVQFALAMGMSILLTVLAVSHLGGLDAMWSGLATLYPADGSATSLAGEPYLTHERVRAFAPDFGEGVVGSLGIPFTAFVLTLGVMWWSSGTVDGSGFMAQRLYTAADAGEAEKGALWYSFANFMLRSWPWAIAGVAALVIFPRMDVDQAAQDFSLCVQDEAVCTQEMRQCLDNRYQCAIPEYTLLVREDDATAAAPAFREDRERGYPALIRELLPAGLMGLMLASLMAAFMSTVSTHINWGASYLANDFYARFINRDASAKQLTRVSRLATLVIAAIAVVVASTVKNIGSMWELYGGMMAGLGLPHLMRWLWWRANAWTEIAGMLTGFTLALVNYVSSQQGWLPPGQMSIFPAFMANHAIHVICWISLIAAIASIAATLATPPVDDALLREFTRRIRPMGWWGRFAGNHTPERGFAQSLLYFAMAGLSIYAGMFGVGYLLRLQTAMGVGLLLVCAVSLFIVVRGMARVDAER